MGDQTFNVDKKGMAQVFRKKGLHRAIEELISNAQDEDGVTKVDVNIKPLGSGNYEISVEDDSPEGFKDLAHAYTLFAPSYKKDDPTKRGRFNFGEKWVIAICKEAKIITTKGGVSFDDEGRHTLRTKRESGTLFTGTLRSNQEEIEKTIRRLKQIIPNENIKVSINGEVLQHRKPLCTFKATLPTIRENPEGDLSPTERICEVVVYEVLPEEKASIFELGIPIVATDDLFHVDVRQKVPLSLNRDNVKPSYLKKLRTLVLHDTHHLIPADKMAATCVREGLADATAGTIEAVLTKQFGEKRAIFDPSDLEANNSLIADGYTVIAPRTFDKETWDRIKETGAVLPSGTIRPTPGKNPDGIAKRLHPDSKTTRMEQVEAYAKMIAREVLQKEISVGWYCDLNAGWAMCWSGNLSINVARLGHKWFERPPVSFPITDILIHEFAHHYSSNHLDEAYYNGLSLIGGKLVELALRKPELFKLYM